MSNKEPNPENASIHQFKEASRVGSFNTTIRCTAIQMLIMGVSRQKVCESLLVTERRLQKRISAFKERGIDGLIQRKKNGGPKKIPADYSDKYVNLINNPKKANRTFWGAKVFHGFRKEAYKVECSCTTVLQLFHEKGFSLKVPRPWPDRQDEEKRMIFRDKLQGFCKDPEIDIWYLDESGFEGESRPRRRWDKKGSKTYVTHNGDHLRMNVIGMVCPRTGEFFAIEVPYVDSKVFQIFLDQANQCIIPQRKRNVIILDNARWHKKRSLNLYGFETEYIPPYSPDLNPIEIIWMIMKQRWFNNHTYHDENALIERLDQAILDLVNSPTSPLCQYT